MATTRATSDVKTISFAQAQRLFKDQVLQHPIVGQRNHLRKLKQGRDHITSLRENPPASQIILQAVKFTGSYKAPMQLIDGYHRLANWMMREEGCPFKRLALVVHSIDALDQAQAEILIDDLARSIDSRKAVKSNADRWTAALRGAGLQAGSSAYQLGKGINSYLKRTLGPAEAPMPVLIARARRHLEAHARMDELYRQTEVHLRAADRVKHFHPGIAQALFKQFVKTPGSGLFENFTAGLYATIYENSAKSQTLTPEAERIHLTLRLIANPITQRKLWETGLREDYFDQCEAIFTSALEACFPAKRTYVKRT